MRLALEALVLILILDIISCLYPSYLQLGFVYADSLENLFLQAGWSMRECPMYVTGEA